MFNSLLIYHFWDAVAWSTNLVRSSSTLLSEMQLLWVKSQTQAWFHCNTTWKCLPVTCRWSGVFSGCCSVSLTVILNNKFINITIIHIINLQWKGFITCLRIDYGTSSKQWPGRISPIQLLWVQFQHMLAFSPAVCDHTCV